MQTSCKPRADLVQTTCYLVQTSCRPHANLGQTSCQVGHNFSQILSRSRWHLDLDLDLDQICEKLGPTWTHYMYSNWSKLVIIFHRSSLDLDLWKIVHSFRNEFFTCLFKIQNVQVIQNDVIKCCKMMSSNVAKWCHHIATSQQRGEIVFHVVIFWGVFVFVFTFDEAQRVLVWVGKNSENENSIVLFKSVSSKTRNILEKQVCIQVGCPRGLCPKCLCLGWSVQKGRPPSSPPQNDRQV